MKTDSTESDTNTVFNTTTNILKSDSIPAGVFEMDSLKTLMIQGMDCDYGDNTNCWMIRMIPAAIGKLSNLETIAFPVNSIGELPKEMAALQKLKNLNLSDNPGLTDIDILTQIPSLEILDLFGCGLRKLPENIGNLKNLKELGLTGNYFITEQEIARIRKALPNCQIIYEKN